MQGNGRTIETVRMKESRRARELIRSVQLHYVLSRNAIVDVDTSYVRRSRLSKVKLVACTEVCVCVCVSAGVDSFFPGLPLMVYFV